MRKLHRKRRINTVTLAASLVLSVSVAWSADTKVPGEDVAERVSPWLALPTLSSDPKLGTSLGAIGAYLHYFDEKSQVSMFGVSAMVTSTDSTLGGVFAKMSFGEDHHRLSAFAGGGVLKNDYQDYLGSGQPLKTTDDLRVLASRYLYRVYNKWFLGVQAARVNYLVSGQSPLDDQILDAIGLTGIQSTGIGAVVMNDTRDNEYSPSRGWVLNLNNMAFRESFGGTANFDAYRLELKGFWGHGRGHVFALRQNNDWTVNAPLSAYATVMLRGYKQGQYLGKYMSSLEGEERLRLSERWRATVFAGLACLYGDNNDCSDSANRYPSYGAGLQYVLKQKEQMVANLEYGAGKEGNYGVYLKLGYAY